MEKTELEYLKDHSILHFQSKIQDIVENEMGLSIILDKTFFYPQGGGQPSDSGEIRTENGTFIVDKVKLDENGIVWHIGRKTEGSLAKGDTVEGSIDEPKRLLHSRIHSAGHVIDMAASQLGFTWKPGKGFHFPEGPYIEYIGEIDPNTKEQLILQLTEKANQLVGENLPVTVIFATPEEMKQYCEFIPEKLPTNKPSRVVLFGDYGIPCGGTHVKNLSEIGKVTIRKIKLSQDTIRIGYDVER